MRSKDHARAVHMTATRSSSLDEVCKRLSALTAQKPEVSEHKQAAVLVALFEVS